MRRTQRAIAFGLLAAFTTQLACGTLLYPERRGQRHGRIDPAVAIMDGLGLLLFLIPGVAAFAVDFATGAIYLPGGRRAEVEVIPFEGDRAADAIDAVERHRGIDIDARRGELRVYRLGDGANLRAQLAAILAGESELAGGPALAAR